MARSRHFSRRKIFEIATEYANTPFAYSHDYFERKFEISKSEFYRLLEKAVMESIVSDNVVLKMEEKAAMNSKNKAGKAGEIRSRKHYIYLRQRRAQFIMLPKQAILVTKKYANTNLSKKQFSNSEYMTVGFLNKTIRNAIINNWIDDDIVEIIKAKSIKSHEENDESVKCFWKSILELRHENRSQG